MSLKLQALIIIAVMLLINAGTFLYVYHTSNETGQIACDAAALTSHEVRDIYARNINYVYPQLYKDNLITLDALDALTTNATAAIYDLREAERKCTEAIDND